MEDLQYFLSVGNAVIVGVALVFHLGNVFGAASSNVLVQQNSELLLVLHFLFNVDDPPVGLSPFVIVLGMHLNPPQQGDFRGTKQITVIVIGLLKPELVPLGESLLLSEVLGLDASQQIDLDDLVDQDRPGVGADVLVVLGRNSKHVGVNVFVVVFHHFQVGVEVSQREQIVRPDVVQHRSICF